LVGAVLVLTVPASACGAERSGTGAPGGTTTVVAGSPTTEQAAPEPGATLLPRAEPVPLGSATLTFTDVIDDSRCPPDAACAWEGELQLGVTWEHAGRVERLVLTWALHADPTTTPDGAFLLALDDLTSRDGVPTAQIRVLDP
jgi:hypothetical protein